MGTYRISSFQIEILECRLFLDAVKLGAKRLDLSLGTQEAVRQMQLGLVVLEVEKTQVGRLHHRGKRRTSTMFSRQTSALLNRQSSTSFSRTPSTLLPPTRGKPRQVHHMGQTLAVPSQ